MPDHSAPLMPCRTTAGLATTSSPKSTRWVLADSNSTKALEGPDCRDSSQNLHTQEEPCSEQNGLKNARFTDLFESLKKIFILLSPVRPGIPCQDQRNCIQRFSKLSDSGKRQNYGQLQARNRFWNLPLKEAVIIRAFRVTL